MGWFAIGELGVSVIKLGTRRAGSQELGLNPVLRQDKVWCSCPHFSPGSKASLGSKSCQTAPDTSPNPSLSLAAHRYGSVGQFFKSVLKNISCIHSIEFYSVLAFSHKIYFC